VNSLGALLLAAGKSSRLGQSKQLLQINGESLVRRQARLLLALNPVCVIVVTGAEQSAVEQALDGLPVQRVHNQNWRQGMGSSIACGIAAMPERVRGALLMLCDQWKITGEDLLALTREWQRQPGTVAIAQWRDASNEESGEEPGQTSGQSSSHLASGPPVVFPRVLFAKLVKLQGEQGARQVIRHFKGEVQRVMLPDAAFDIDQPGDWPQTVSHSH
jgi:molybdenum cofactor cytidylyltransferase